MIKCLPSGSSTAEVAVAASTVPVSSLVVSIAGIAVVVDPSSVVSAAGIAVFAAGIAVVAEASRGVSIVLSAPHAGRTAVVASAVGSSLAELANGAVTAAAIVSAPRVPLVLGSTGRGALLPGRSSMPASASQHAGLSGRKHTRLVLLAGRRFVLFAGRSTWPGRRRCMLLA